jgi:plastocyanin
MPVKIDIHVLPDNTNPGQGRAGTFLSPGAQIKIGKGDTVQWSITPATWAFQVRFQGQTPLVDADLNPVFEVNKKATGGPQSDAYTAHKPGQYHYSVAVTNGTDVFTVSQCPEVDVDF